MTTLAYSHTLTPGTPENVNDVQDMFGDISTLVNGNLDAGNMATSMKPATLMGAYRTVGVAPFFVTSLTSIAGTYYTTVGGQILLSGTSGATNAPALLPVNLTGHAVTGLATSFRLVVSYLVNGVGPNITFTYGLYPVTSTSGSNVLVTTLGTVVTGSTIASVNPGGPGSTLTGSDFTITGSAGYLVGIALSAMPTGNSIIAGQVALQVHNI